LRPRQRTSSPRSAADRAARASAHGPPAARLADKLLRSYDRDVRRLSPLLADRFGRDRAEQLNARIREAFAASQWMQHHRYPGDWVSDADGPGD